MDVINTWMHDLPTMLEGLKWSVFIALVAIAIGYPLGLLLALGVNHRNAVIRWVCLAFVEIGRGAPALVILYLVYYGLPKFGVSLDNIPAACIGLGWNAAAYSSEMIRGGLQSVARGQLEAASALGLNNRGTFWKVIFPQGMRSSTPALMGLAIQMFQGTSLAYGIAVPELMKQAYTIGAENFSYLQTFILAGLVYAVIAVPATWITSYFERRMARKY